VSETQFYILATVLTGGLGAVAAAIRFSVSRVVAALDANSKAMLDNTASNAVLSTKIDDIARHVRERELTPVEGVPTKPMGQYSVQIPRKATEPGKR
jgi:hypothetical protein